MKRYRRSNQISVIVNRNDGDRAWWKFTSRNRPCFVYNVEYYEGDDNYVISISSFNDENFIKS